MSNKNIVLLENLREEANMYMDLMSHDLTNFHQIAIGYIELAIDEIENDTDKEKQVLFLKNAHKAIEDSSKLVCRAARIKKHDEGQYKPQKINVAEIMEQIIASTHNERITIKYEELCEECVVLADELMLPMYKQIIDNSIKHSTGPVNIRVVLDKVRVNEDIYCRVIIEDDGPGIPESMKQKLYRGYRTKHCTGYGSYAVSNLVASYNGRILLEDRVTGDHTKGTRVIVEIPETKEK
jgi:signal transduction histidine kinase